jgi:hypothetical protein
MGAGGREQTMGAAGTGMTRTGAMGVGWLGMRRTSAARRQLLHNPAPLPNSAVQTLIAAASLAPSIHNTQPWSFHVHGTTIDMHADLDRALVACVDPHARQLTISCGAALFNMRVAAAHLGRQLDVTLLPDPSVPTLLASATIGPHLLSRDRDAALYPEIKKRHTYRRGFVAREIPGLVVAELADAARREHAAFIVIGKGDRPWLFDLIAMSDAILADTPGYADELRHWTNGRTSRLEGVPAAAYGTVPAGGAPPLRNFGLTDPAVSLPVEHFRADPTIAILSTARDDPGSWLRAGQGLQRVLLVGCQRGLAASFLNQPLEVPDARREMLGYGKPQMILRLGYPGDVVSTPRRGLADITQVHSDTQQNSNRPISADQGTAASA